MVTLISSQTAAAISDPFAVAGEAKIVTDPLVGDEYVRLLEELPNGTYQTAVNKNGVGVVLHSRQPSHVFVGYGNYRVEKSLTASAVAVGFEE